MNAYFSLLFLRKISVMIPQLAGLIGFTLTAYIATVFDNNSGRPKREQSSTKIDGKKKLRHNVSPRKIISYLG